MLLSQDDAAVGPLADSADARPEDVSAGNAALGIGHGQTSVHTRGEDMDPRIIKGGNGLERLVHDHEMQDQTAREALSELPLEFVVALDGHDQARAGRADRVRHDERCVLKDASALESRDICPDNTADSVCHPFSADVVDVDAVLVVDLEGAPSNHFRGDKARAQDVDDDELLVLGRRKESTGGILLWNVVRHRRGYACFHAVLFEQEAEGLLPELGVDAPKGLVDSPLT